VAARSPSWWWRLRTRRGHLPHEVRRTRSPSSCKRRMSCASKTRRTFNPKIEFL
jgi:hypothetical protein